MARPEAHGIINLDKPVDATSMDMVRLAKRVTKVKHVGHAGTLDPIASGVLPICFGQATRLMEHMVGGRKVYRAGITLGVSTDTYDAQGKPVRTADPAGVTRDQVEALLPRFVGKIMQRPPMYSALKHDGQRLYDLARDGVEVERDEREVVVYRLALVDWAPPLFTIEAECGRGFYVRTLAHDLGEALGCGAHMSSLVRTRAGHFAIEDSITPDRLEAAGADGSWEDLLVPPDAAVLDMEALVVESAAERHLRNGQAATLRNTSMYVQHLEPRRAYSHDGRFLGIIRFNRPVNQWQPEKMFSLPEPSRYAPVVR
ncbi:MAG: tRNA pseudouridine(55) synthase TruB [SAR202 cluster bacterium]|nr:tRNA pseudouridine(55) synthase TruB [SAR202 cluster bacterium]